MTPSQVTVTLGGGRGSEHRDNPDIRSALFGNLEKIRDFHQDLLLPDLERSKLRSSKIASIFLKYVSNIFDILSLIIIMSHT